MHSFTNFYLGTKWKLTLASHPSLSIRGEERPVLIKLKGNSQGRSGRRAEGINLLPLTRFEPHIV